MANSDSLIADALRVLPKFGVSPLATLTRLNSGEYAVFRVDDELDRFVLRLRHSRMSDAARSLQLAWLRTISAETTIGVPEPVLTIDGADAVLASRDLVGTPGTWVLLRWVWGERVAKPSAFVTPAVLASIGDTVARLHEHSATYRPSNLSDAPTVDVADLVGGSSCLADGSAERLVAASDLATFHRAGGKVATAMDELRSMPAQSGLIHGDLNPANWVFHEGQPRVIDFDEYSHGLFLFDLMGVLSTHTMWKEYHSLQQSLIDGYARVRPLPPQVKSLAGVMQAACLFAWLNHGCRLSDPNDQAEFLKWVPATADAVSRLVGVGR